MTDSKNLSTLTQSINIFEFARNINLIALIKSIQDKFVVGKHLYLQNKKNVDIVLCIVCFFLIVLEWLDLSLISNLYFLGLTYMTVRTVGNFYNKMLPTQYKSKNLEESYLKRGIEALDSEQSHKILLDFSLLANNWLIYSSLIFCDYVFQTINSLIGGGIILGSILQMGRFLLYMQYCRQFIKSLEPYCEEKFHVDNIYISDELAKKISLSVYIKHLINIMAINNVLCFNLFAKANLKILTLIDNCSSSGVDMLSNIIMDGLKQASKVKSSFITVRSTNYIHSLIQKLKSFLFSESKELKKI